MECLISGRCSSFHHSGRGRTLSLDGAADPVGLPRVGDRLAADGGGGGQGGVQALLPSQAPT